MKRMTIKHFRPMPDEAVSPRQALITEETLLLDDKGNIGEGIRSSGTELPSLTCIAVTGSPTHPFVPSPLACELCALYRTTLKMGEPDFILTTNQYSAEVHHPIESDVRRLKIMVQEARATFRRRERRSQKELEA